MKSKDQIIKLLLHLEGIIKKEVKSHQEDYHHVKFIKIGLRFNDGTTAHKDIGVKK